MTCYTVEDIKTKSGHKVIVVGKSCPKKGEKQKPSDLRLWKKTGKTFVKYYNNNFTKREQSQIGNIFYDFYNNKNTDAQMSIEEKKRFGAKTSYIFGERAEQLNPGYNKMIDITFNHKALKDLNKEIITTHELIHAKKFMSGKSWSLWDHNEKKTEFETVGRVSEEGIREFNYGYYYNPKSSLLGKKAEKEKWSNRKTYKQIKGVIQKDRILLTGSLEKHLIGKPIERMVKEKYPQSYFNKIKI